MGVWGGGLGLTPSSCPVSHFVQRYTATVSVTGGYFDLEGDSKLDMTGKSQPNLTVEYPGQLGGSPTLHGFHARGCQSSAVSQPLVSGHPPTTAKNWAQQ